MRLGLRKLLRPADIGRSSVLALVLACCSAWLAPTAQAATGPEYFGTNLQTLSATPSSKWGTILDQLAAGRMTVDRFEVNWRTTEPTDPAKNGGTPIYKWATVDAFVALMAQHGLRAAPIFRYAPDWARGPASAAFPKGDELPPSRYADFARFIADFAKRYGPGGAFWQGTAPDSTWRKTNPTVPSQPMQAYEIWNEVNLDEYAWNDHADPVAMAGLLKVIRPSLKAVQPGAVLLTNVAWQDSRADDPGTYPQYIAAFAAAGGLDAIDAMGFHPYAPDADTIFTLVRRLRSQLTAAGHPTMPIYANENGLPVTYTGPGTQFAANLDPAHPETGFPTDGARASSLEFAGYALAASDCGVDQFLPYSVSGTETSAERINEGYMGIFRKADGAPTLTSMALQRASRQWAAHFDPGGTGAPAPLVICGAGASPPASLLPITASFTGAGNGCVDLVDTYNGNPMESVMLRLVDRNGAELGRARSDAYGHARACVPDLNAALPFRAFAEIAGAGISGAVICDVPVVGCPTGRTISPSGTETVSARTATGYTDPPPPTPQESVAAKAQREAAAALAKIDVLRRCAWSAKASMMKRTLRGRTTKSRLTVRGLTTCAVAPPGTTVRFVVTLKRKGSKKETKLRSLFLTSGTPRSVDLVGKFAKSDSIVLLHADEPTTGVPRIRTSVSVGAKLVRR